jgi:hypothetical protein
MGEQQAIPERLLSSARTYTVHLSTTSRCNLRCVYCEVSAPGYGSSDFDFTQFDGVVRILKERGVKWVSFYGEGENLFRAGIGSSPKSAGRIPDGPHPNLARRLGRRKSRSSHGPRSPSRATTDGRVQGPRTGVSILIHNMVDLGCGAPHERPHEGRHVALRTEHHELRTLVSVGGAGAVGQLLPKTHNDKVFCITTLPDEQFREATDVMDRARELATSRGRRFELQAGFAQVLERRSAGARATAAAG